MNTLELTKKLISSPSISPEDAGCQQILAEALQEIGFNITHLPFEDVSNLWATHGDQSPRFVFAGHTDVVPPGPAEQWKTPPFVPTLVDNVLYGRGAADMKGSLAAMITASRKFLKQYPKHKGSLAFLITSDEEADAINGTVKMVEYLEKHGIRMDWCVIGEPSSSKQTGDVIRTGRRGSLNADLRFRGIQGHIAYPDKAVNPIHGAMSALSELVATEWDQGNEYFPPTSMQISNIHAGTGVNNVIPGEMNLKFNFRFSSESSAEELKARVHALLDRHNLDYTLSWMLSGHPFLTRQGVLISAVQQSIRQIMKLETRLSTSGGTSDGRFIAPTGTEVVELGPCNQTIHQANECVDLIQLNQLTDIYFDILKRLLL